jgi:hypothetical protein
MLKTPTLRRVVMTAVAASAVALAIGGVSIADAGGHHAANHTFTLKEVDNQAAFVNISHSKNGKPGDEFIFHANFTSSSGHVVATADVVCTLVFNGNANCVGTAVFADGSTIAVSALAPKSSSAATHVAITGGTGRFAKVRGQMVSTPTGDNTSTDVFHLNY